MQLQHCYFHPSNFITSFCAVKSCTLPLCSVCQQIHQTDHKKQGSSAQIKNYSQVQENALKQLRAHIACFSTLCMQMTKKLDNEQKQVIQIISSHYKKQIDAIKFHFKTQNAENMVVQIEKGSIKATIQYYSESILTSKDKNKKFQGLKQRIQKAIDQTIKQPIVETIKQPIKQLQKDDKKYAPKQLQQKTLLHPESQTEIGRTKKVLSQDKENRIHQRNSIFGPSKGRKTRRINDSQTDRNHHELSKKNYVNGWGKGKQEYKQCGLRKENTTYPDEKLMTEEQDEVEIRQPIMALCKIGKEENSRLSVYTEQSNIQMQTTKFKKYPQPAKEILSPDQIRRMLVQRLGNNGYECLKPRVRDPGSYGLSQGKSYNENRAARGLAYMGRGDIGLSNSSSTKGYQRHL